MFFIDIAVPRDVDPEMNKLDGIFVYDIDDLQQAVTTHVADRQKEADRAEAIISGEVERFQQRLQTLDVVPTIVSLQDHLETIRQAEIDRVRGRLGRSLRSRNWRLRRSRAELSARSCIRRSPP